MIIQIGPVHIVGPEPVPLRLRDPSAYSGTLLPPSLIIHPLTWVQDVTYFPVSIDNTVHAFIALARKFIYGDSFEDFADRVTKFLHSRVNNNFAIIQGAVDGVNMNNYMNNRKSGQILRLSAKCGWFFMRPGFCSGWKNVDCGVSGCWGLGRCGGRGRAGSREPDRGASVAPNPCVPCSWRGVFAARCIRCYSRFSVESARVADAEHHIYLRSRTCD